MKLQQESGKFNEVSSEFEKLRDLINSLELALEKAARKYVSIRKPGHGLADTSAQAKLCDDTLCKSLSAINEKLSALSAEVVEAISKCSSDK